MEFSDDVDSASMYHIIERGDKPCEAFGNVVGKLCVVATGEVEFVLDAVFSCGPAERAFCCDVNCVRLEVFYEGLKALIGADDELYFWVEGHGDTGGEICGAYDFDVMACGV